MLQNKRAVITGGSDGIGFAIAKKFVQNGAEVIIIGRDEQKLQNAKKSLNTDKVLTISADLSDITSLKKVTDEILSQWDGVDILVNNAAVALFKEVKDISYDEIERVFKLNVHAPFLMVQNLLNSLKKREGNIINMSSYLSHKMLPNRPASIYSTSKGAMDAMTKSMAFEFGNSKVRVNTIAPGTTNTNLVKNVLASMPVDKKDQFLNSVKTIYPLQRLGEPEDISGLALFLASDEARWITGTIISADGGLTAG